MEGDTVCSVKPDNRAQHPSKHGGRIEMNSLRRCMFERQARRCVRIVGKELTKELMKG